MQIKEAIAYLRTLTQALVSAVTNEKNEAGELKAQYANAIAAKDEAIAKLSAEILSLKAQMDPEVLTGLESAVQDLNGAIAGISSIVETTNPTPIADVVFAVVEPEKETVATEITDAVESAAVLEESVSTLVG